MVAPAIRPLSIGFATGSILVIVESAFLGALPSLALASTFLAPLITTAASAWSRHKVLSAEDTKDVFDPLYGEILKNRDQIASSENYGNIPAFQLGDLDRIRRGARYTILKDRVPGVESLRESMEVAVTSQGDATQAANRIIREAIPSVLGTNGITVSFQGRTKDGNSANFEGDTWISPMLVRGRDPYNVLRMHIEVERMAVKDRNNSPAAALEFPKDEKKYRHFWDAVEGKAREDREIRRCRDALDKLPVLADEAQSQVMKEIKKSRSIF